MKEGTSRAAISWILNRARIESILSFFVHCLEAIFRVVWGCTKKRSIKRWALKHSSHEQRCYMIWGEVLNHLSHFKSGSFKKALTELSVDFCLLYQSSHSDLKDIMYDQDAILRPNNKSILVWLTEVYTTSYEFEIRTFNSSLLAIIMKKQLIN